MPYVQRALEARVAGVLKTHPVVVLTGPRQVGKSTLLKNAAFLQGWRYLTLDDPDVLDQAREDPKGLLGEDKPTILDEVQRHAPIFLVVKYFVDRSQGKRKFILSGSGNVSLRKEPRESLAGRARYLHLTPLGVSELFPRRRSGALDTLFSKGRLDSTRTRLKIDALKATWRGGLPKMALAGSAKSVLEILAGYVDTYIERDIQDLVKIRHPENFRRLMAALAKSTGWTTVQEELSNISGEERSNVSRHMSLLKETGLLYEVKGYGGRGERAYRQAKYFWFDSGIACFLAGIHAPGQLKPGGVKGRYFENLVFQQLLFFSSLQIVPAQIFYWRPKGAELEVDFVLKHQGGVLPVEVKSSEGLTYRDTRAMRQFLKVHPEAKWGILVYAGSRVYPIATGIYAVPWTEL